MSYRQPVLSKRGLKAISIIGWVLIPGNTADLRITIRRPVFAGKGCRRNGIPHHHSSRDIQCAYPDRELLQLQVCPVDRYVFRLHLCILLHVGVRYHVIDHYP